MKKIFILLIALIIVVIGIFVFINSSQGSEGLASKGSTRTVNYDGDKGYDPSEIKIKKGDIVTFKNNSDKHFWPASDIHPTHGIYPEFDPQDAIMPGGTWRFKFEKTGTWRFHDHLAPYFTGRITVE